MIALWVHECMHGEGAVRASSNFKPEVLRLDFGTAPAPEPFGALERFGDVVDLHGEDDALRPTPVTPPLRPASSALMKRWGPATPPSTEVRRASLMVHPNTSR